MVFSAAAGSTVNQKYSGVESLIGSAACAGLAVMAMVISTGHISGAHFNPSVTIAFAVLRHFPWIQVPGYLAAHAGFCFHLCCLHSQGSSNVFHPFMSGGVTVPAVSTGQAFALEFIVTYTFLFVITAVATDTRAVCITAFKSSFYTFFITPVGLLYNYDK
ncbi:hypothetical protein FH972_000682 [Carpinus fangiana]|uniref:Aquaporin n=1 Tax=Carpinus fangiana TaxID=176857 RepID=A0A5N6Q9T1_9ROSI|nr:hypothetical protein FH972_000682 [Carpinus fangiana]